MYTANDFNTENAPKEMVQHVIDNVEDFNPRYAHAWNIIGRDRCPLRMADPMLYDDIMDAMSDWCSDNSQDVDNYEVEEVFG